MTSIHNQRDNLLFINKRLEQQRDELLAALRKLRETHVRMVGMWTDPAVRQADTAIAKAERIEDDYEQHKYN